MARGRLADFLFAIAVVSLPLSYAVKNILGYTEATWVDPTLILGTFVFLLVGWQFRRRPGWPLIALAGASGTLGWLLHKVEPGHGHAEWFVVATDPVSLALCLIWFWVCVIYFTRKRRFVMRWLATGVIAELVIAVYLYLAMLRLVPAPSFTNKFLETYLVNQAIWLAGLPIPRMGGTFQEAPIFGLYMLSCFAILAAEWMRCGRRSDKLVRLGTIAAAVGIVASLSDQTLAALGVFLALASYQYTSAKWTRRATTVVLASVLSFYVVHTTFARERSESAVSVYGESVGERAFHAEYALRILSREPAALFLGIGPGRYGDYAFSTGMFPSTVTPQVTPVEWLVGYGIFGSCAICFWLYEIADRARRFLGVLGMAVFCSLLLADMFQSRWFWEAWFTALAYLYASSAYPVRMLNPTPTPSANPSDAVLGAMR